MPDPSTLADPSGLMEWAKLGATGLIFLIWWLTFKLSTKQQKDALDANKESVEKLTEKMVDAYKDSLESHREQNEILQQIIKDDQENQAHLITVLTQLKERLNQPIKCPVYEANKFNSQNNS